MAAKAKRAEASEGFAESAPSSRQRGIDRTIDLCEALRQEGRSMRIGDLAARIGAPRSTVYDIVNRMVDAQVFEILDGGRVYFGRAMFLYGRAYADSNAFYLRSHLEAVAADASRSAACALQGTDAWSWTSAWATRHRA